MTEPLKRKHVVFNEESAHPAQAVPSGPYIHPSRAAASAVLSNPTTANAAVPGAAPAAKKPKVSLSSTQNLLPSPVGELTYRRRWLRRGT